MKASENFLFIVFLFFIFIFSSEEITLAQFSNSRTDFFYNVKRGDTLQLKYKNVIPNSLEILTRKKQKVNEAFNINFMRGKLICLSDSFKLDTLMVNYRIFPFEFLESYYFRKYIQTGKVRDSLPKNEIAYGFEYKPFIPVQFSKLSSSGSITRGITIGTNQDLVVNSGLRMQIEGNITDSISIVASITDANIPIQPEGNTQDIRDFDKVFIQMKSPKIILTAGDIELKNPENEFLKYYKNVIGGQLQAKLGVSKNFSSELTLSASASKGRFHSITFTPETSGNMEGRQGPYKLTGRNGELFLIVLAGSENVYINGEKMTRGENNDYIINYNTGEIFFTSHRIITNNSRITVDFEYSDRNYARTIAVLNLNNTFYKKLNVQLDYYTEGDNPNSPIDLSLSENDIKKLQTIGDTSQSAFTTTFDTVAYNASFTQYTRTDTVVYGITYTNIYKYSQSSADSFYKVVFSHVGTGKGNYKKNISVVNGGIFEWIAPDSVTQTPKGDYEAIKVLVPPKRSSIIHTKINYAFNKSTNITAEYAGSILDKNKFSRFNDSDNYGNAMKFSFNTEKLSLKGKEKSVGKLSFGFYTRIIDERFNSIDRFNSVEYDRDWNLGSANSPTEEKKIGGHIHYFTNHDMDFRAESDYLDKRNTYQGLKNKFSFNSMNKKFISGNGYVTQLQTKADSVNTSWYLHKGNFYKKVWIFQPGISSEWEDKKSLWSANDSVLDKSFLFLQLEPRIANAPGKKLNYSLSYNWRKDEEVLSGKYLDKSLSNTVSLRTNFSKSENFKFQLLASLRNYEIIDSVFKAQGLTNKKSFATNVQTDYAFIKRSISASTFVEFISEQEQKKDFAYVEVKPGEGNYQWVDADSDGVKDLNEFQTAYFSDQANFVRVFVLSNEYIPTFNSRFSQNLNLNFYKIAKGKTFGSKVIRKISSTTIFNVEKKLRSDSVEGKIFNPVYLQLSDTNLVSATQNFRNIFYINRIGSVFGMELEYSDNRNKILLSGGFETRQNVYQQISARYIFKQSVGFYLAFKYGNKFLTADEFPSKNTDINYYSVSPKTNIQFNKKFRTSLNLSYGHKENTVALTEANSDAYSAGAESNYLVKEKNAFLTNINFVNINYSGATTTYLQNEMLEGLLPGNNFTWGAFYSQRVGKYLDMSFGYEGRASAGNPPVHTGRMQMRALF